MEYYMLYRISEDSELKDIKFEGFQDMVFYLNNFFYANNHHQTFYFWRINVKDTRYQHISLSTIAEKEA